MKALLSSFTSPAPIPVGPKVRSLVLPPVVSVDGSIDLDYCALIFFDQMVLDRSSFDSVTNSEMKVLDQLKKSMNLLKSEGLLEPVIYADIAKEQLPLVINAAAQSAKEVKTWLPALQDEVRTWREIRSPMQKILDPYYGGFGQATYGVSAFLFQKYGEIDKFAVDELDRKILNLKVNKKRWADDEIETLTSIICPVLECINLNLAVADKIGCRNVFDWSTLNQFYKTKYLVHLQRDESVHEKRVNKVKELFNLSFPQFMPRNAEDWLRFISNKKVVELRKRINDAISTGETFDTRFAVNSLNELRHAEHRVHNLERIVGWATMPIGLLPGGHFAQEAIKEGVSFLAKKRILAKHSWMYFCSEKKRS